jgi:hypothetical protein
MAFADSMDGDEGVGEEAALAIGEELAGPSARFWALLSSFSARDFSHLAYYLQSTEEWPDRLQWLQTKEEVDVVEAEGGAAALRAVAAPGDRLAFSTAR